jgi:hypothetical protein
VSFDEQEIRLDFVLGGRGGYRVEGVGPASMAANLRDDASSRKRQKFP